MPFAHAQRQKIRDCESVFRFLQLLCEGHYQKLQLYLRQQKKSAGNVDIMELILYYFRETLFVRNSNFSNLLNVNLGNITTLTQSLETLIEMVQGQLLCECFPIKV
jgi:hypothetical protein